MSLVDALLLEPYPLDIWVAVRTDSAKGSGTLNDPWDGSTEDKFDGIMSSIPANTKVRIHLGPGTFKTRGYADGVTGVGWQPQANWQIVGSGMEVTTLQVVGAATADKHYFAVGHALASGAQQGVQVDYFEISDLTIDCNLQATPQAAYGAIRVMGNHVKVRKVKVKNWGTNSTVQQICFVISVVIGDPEATNTEVVNAGIEECIAVNPSSSNTGKVNVLHVGAKDFNTSLEAFPKAPYIRNCYVDCGALADPLAPEIRALFMSSCRGGVVEGNQVQNTRYGGPYLDKLSTRSIVVRNNFYRNVVKGPFWNMGGTLSPVVNLNSLTRDGTKATATVDPSPSVSHKLSIGDRVKIAATPSNFNGFFEITEIPQVNQFRYSTTEAAATATNPTMQKVFGVDKAVVEANTIELATFTAGASETPIGIHLADTTLISPPPPYVHGDILVRENKIRYVDGQFSSSYIGTGIRVEGANNLLVQDNVVDVYPSNSIQNFRCGSVKYFNSKTPAGALIQGYNGVAQTKYSELETEAEDALLLTLL